MYIREDSPKVLQRFGPQLGLFSISHYIWNKIHDASEDTVRHYPYAPYLMHVIEQVTGIWFPTDVKHKKLKITNKMFKTAKKALEEARKGKATGASTSHASSQSSSEEPLSSSSGKKKPCLLKFCMTYIFGQCCAAA